MGTRELSVHISLNRDEYEALKEEAQRELRTIAAQGAYLLRPLLQALRERDESASPVSADNPDR